MGGPLIEHVTRYVNGRARRGEISKDTVAGLWSALGILAEVHGDRPMRLFGQTTIERWLELRRDLKPSTKRTQWSYISCFADWLVEERLIRVNPCRRMKAPRQPRTEPRALDAEAVAKLLAVVPDNRARAIVWLEVGLGLRRVEVHRAKIEDWSRRDQLLRVLGKGGHERHVPVITEAVTALTAYLCEHPATVGPLIRSYTRPDRSLAVSTLTHSMSLWLTEAGVKIASRDGVSQHALRHTCASDVLDECGDLRIVQELLGHAHLSSTAVYLRRARLGKMREAMEGRDYSA